MPEVLFVLSVLGLSWWYLLWWQYLLLIIVAILLAPWRLLGHRVLSLDCTHLDELWDIRVQKGSQAMLWHGYLSAVQTVFDGQKGVFLRFYVIAPHKRYINVVIRQADTDESSFRQLLGLAHGVGGRFGRFGG